MIGGMRRLPSVIAVGLLLVGCSGARGPSVVGYAVAGQGPSAGPPIADPAPAEPLTPEPVTPAPAKPSAAPEAAADGAHAKGEVAEPDAPPAAPCHLKATLRDAGAKADGRRFVLMLKNEGAAPVRIVLPGDGSEVGWRTPIVTWSATKKGRPVAPIDMGRCGMVNRIDASEVVTLAPGASQVIDHWLSSPPYKPGAYDVRLTYRNDPGVAPRADTDPAVAALLAGTSACEATTNVVRARLR